MAAFKFFSMMPPYSKASGIDSAGPIWWRAKYYGPGSVPLAPPLERIVGDLAAIEAGDAAGLDGWAEGLATLATIEAGDAAGFVGA